MKLVCLVIFTALLLQGCGATQEQLDEGYFVTKEPYSQISTFHAFNAGSLKGEPFLKLQIVAFEVFSRQLNDVWLSTFYIKYDADDWLFISPGESLIMLVDGEPMGLNTFSGSSNGRTVGGIARVHERVSYAISTKQLQKIAAFYNNFLKVVDNKA